MSTKDLSGFMKSHLLISLFLLLSFRAFTQSCTLNVTLSQSAPAICSGSNVTLTATATGGTAPYIYVWSTGETTPSINADKAGTYTVSVSDKTPGCQPVKSSVTITVSATPIAPTAANVTICPNSSATLTATAPGGNYQWYDKAKGGTFLVSGASYTTGAIATDTVFYVETTVAGCTSARTAVFVTLTGKPSVSGATVCSGSSAVLSASGGSSYTWYDAPGGGIIGSGPTYTTPVLTATTTYYVVVISNNGCTSAFTPVTAKIAPAPPAPTAAGVSVCAGSSANLHANAPAGVLNWYDVPIGGIPLITSTDYTTPPLTTTTTYYVETSLNNCVSPRTPVTVTVNPIPLAPAPQSVTICFGTSASLTEPPLPAGTYQWYTVAAGGTPLATGPNYNTSALTNSTIYYVEVDNGGCASPRSVINVTVLPQLLAPSVSGALICPGSAATLTATGPGGTYNWYSVPVGGSSLYTGPSYTTTALNANTTYYIETTITGCTSSRTAVTVSMLPVVPAPVASNTTVCSGSSATLTATAASNNFAWYDSGGTLLSSAPVYTTPALTATTTYYVETTANGCTSSRTPVTVTVNPLPSPPTASGVAICSGTSTTLTATTAVGTVQWYNVPAGGISLKTGNSYTTPVLSANTTYYIQSINGQCTSARVPVTVSMIAVANPQFQYASGTFCTASPNPTPVINNPSGGTFSAVPAGLVFVSNTTGQINIAASTPGLYTVSFSSNGLCPGISSALIAIVTTPNATFTYNGPYCQDGTNPLPTFPIAGSSPGNFSASPAGLTFLNTSTGEIDLIKSNAGTYIVTNTIGASGTCPTNVAIATVIIDPAVIVRPGPPQTVIAGSTVQLAGSITGGTTTGTWSGGTGTFSNPNSLTAVYTPGTGETVATLTLTSADPPGPCGRKSNTVTITIIPNPAPTAAGVSVCSGNGATLSATAPGGPYQWYSTAAGSTPLATGPTFTTPPLTVSTTYYVQTTMSGAASSRTAVVVTVNAPPVQPIAPGQQICTGNPATLTASGSTGTYQWYDAAVGGNLLSQNNPYLTSPLITNTSYFVQATLNGCASPRTQVDVTVNSVPNITSAANGTVCTGNALNYTITADVATATFSWSRAQVAGISNPAIVNQASAIINETLINTTNNAINVTYIIIPAAGNCPGPSFNYVVTVYPSPVVTSAVNATVCNMNPINYAVTFNTPVTNFSWSRAAVPGISNAAVSGQSAGVIKEVLFNTTNAPIDVTYVFNYNLSTCAGPPFNFVVTINPSTAITSATFGTACSGFPQNYAITANVPGTTYTWSRGLQKNIANPVVTGQTSDTITETLINTGQVAAYVGYVITPIANGCPGPRFVYTVRVNPPIAIPVANSNSPVCAGSIIQLRTNPVLNATYAWTGPNGFTSTLQNPDIDNVSAANSGTYSLVVTVNGCSTLPVTTQAAVDQLPVANAGGDQSVCITASSVPLAGSVTGGTTTGIWTTSGTGTFSPSSNALNGQYLLSAADKAAGSVVLTLTSTSKDNCNVSTSSMRITFKTLPAVVAGPDQEACSQAASVKLNGTLLIPGNAQWTTSGTGTFSPSANLLGANYIPSPADMKNGSVTLTLNIIGAGICYIPSDSLTVKFIPPPSVYAGGTKYVLKGNTITLKPVVSDNNVHYLWSPNIDINNDTLKNPVITGTVSRTYTLTVTDSRGCINQDSTYIKVTPPIHIDNTFTPNGDGINDFWDVSGLIAYVDATVDIFDRYGQKVFHSIGYPKAWDGTYNGKPCAVGVYYYVINTNFNGQVLSGYVTIIR